MALPAGTSRYHEVYSRSMRDPAAFWGEAAQDIDWYEQPAKVFDPQAGVYGRWFVGATCNTCFNAVDRHVGRGRGRQNAIIHDSPLAGEKRAISYAELLSEVATLAAVLREFGVGTGDRVILYMPAVPEAVIAMLACARIGAIHSVVFGGFAPRSSRSASTTAGRKSSCRPAAASSRAASSHTSHCSTRRSRFARKSRKPA